MRRSRSRRRTNERITASMAAIIALLVAVLTLKNKKAPKPESKTIINVPSQLNEKEIRLSRRVSQRINALKNDLMDSIGRASEGVVEKSNQIVQENRRRSELERKSRRRAMEELGRAIQNAVEDLKRAP